MWKAKITNVEKDGELAKVTFEYFHTDGRNKMIIERISESNSIKMIAQNALRELQRIDDLNNLIANPPIGEIEFVTEPTAEEIAKQAEFQKIEQLKASKELVSLGLMTDAEYQAKLASINSIEINK